MNDIEVILKALQRERDDLHQQLMQVDRIIKRVKCGTYVDDKEQKPVPQIQAENTPVRPKTISPALDLKIQVLRVLDVLGVACTLKQIQAEFTALTGNKANVRESIRSLQNSTIVRLIKDKSASRGFLWAKSQWIENNQLLDKHKPEGFDLLYKPDNLIYE